MIDTDKLFLTDYIQQAIGSISVLRPIFNNAGYYDSEAVI